MHPHCEIPNLTAGGALFSWLLLPHIHLRLEVSLQRDEHNQKRQNRKEASSKR